MSKENWQRELTTVLIQEIDTIREMLATMKPKNEAEFRAVLLPNLHTNLWHFINPLIEEAYNEGRRDERDETVKKLSGLFDFKNLNEEYFNSSE